MFSMCVEKCQEFDLSKFKQDVDELRNTLKQNSIIRTKNSLQKYLNITALAKNGKLGYYFADREFCIKAFSLLSGVSVYLLSKVKQDLLNGHKL